MSDSPVLLRQLVSAKAGDRKETVEVMRVNHDDRL
jgi:hypothetical protein